MCVIQTDRHGRSAALAAVRGQFGSGLRPLDGRAHWLESGLEWRNFQLEVGLDMEDISGIHLRRLHGRLGEVVIELTRVRYSRFASAEVWQPAINAYRCRGRITVCVDLAGVDRGAVRLKVERRQLMIRGRREPPEPKGDEPEALQVLAMEIDYGSFERWLDLPLDVDSPRVTTEQRNGLLWIHLPLAAES